MPWTEGEGTTSDRLWVTVLGGLRSEGNEILAMFLLWLSSYFPVTVEEALGQYWLGALAEFHMWVSRCYQVGLVVGASKQYMLSAVLF